METTCDKVLPITVTETAGKTLPRNKGGAPAGNQNRMSHGIRGWLTIGSLPKGASYARRIAGEFRRQIENATLAIHGELSPYHSALCQSATRHELRAILAGRWLKQQGDALSVPERLQLLGTIGNATDARDKCLEKLGLNKLPKSANPWEALDRLAANGNGHAISNSHENQALSQPKTEPSEKQDSKSNPCAQ